MDEQECWNGTPIETCPSATIAAANLIWTALLFNPLNAELNHICHLLALLGGATIVVVSRLRVKAVLLGEWSSCNCLKHGRTETINTPVV
jgi:hypothetical protein